MANGSGTSLLASGIEASDMFYIGRMTVVFGMKCQEQSAQIPWLWQQAARNVLIQNTVDI